MSAEEAIEEEPPVEEREEVADVDPVEDGIEEDDDVTVDGCPNGCVPESEMLVTKDLNLDFPWKSGNKYARICPECGSRNFTTRTYWETVEVSFVIPREEEKPRPLYRCPYTEEVVDEGEEPCGEEFVGPPLDEGLPEACPECERPLSYGD